MNKLDKSQEFDSYELDEPSDEERAVSSSEDELDVLLNGTAEQKKKLIREYLTGESESSSGDEFEKEMEAELSSTIRNMEGTWVPTAGEETEVEEQFAAAAPSQTEGRQSGLQGSEDFLETDTNEIHQLVSISGSPVRYDPTVQDDAAGGADGGGGGGSGPPNPQMYDQVYFDSDSDEEDTPSSSTDRRRKQRIIPTNDELLYDPEEDDRDQAWVDARRYYNRKRPPAASRPPRLPNSDAILNCPACMTTLCLDCQRHEKYRTQYRAMFVMNCTVRRDEVLRYKSQQVRKPRKRRRGQKTEAPADEAAASMPVMGMDTDEVYHPVKCSECSTEVGVFDKDEVYHFFNILASHC